MLGSTQFFLGTVKIQSFTFQTTTFKIVGVDTLITVRNDIHLRLNNSLFSNSFQILAPISAIEVKEGKIPAEALGELELEQYLLLRDNRRLRKKFAKQIKDDLSKIVHL